MESVETIIIVIVVCGILPLVFVWLETRAKMEKNKLTSEIVLAAIEKNPDIDIKEFANSLSHKKNLTPEERTIRRLQTGCACLIIGICLIALYLCGVFPEISEFVMIASVVLVGIGIGAIVAYFVGKKAEKKAENEK